MPAVKFKNGKKTAQQAGEDGQTSGNEMEAATEPHVTRSTRRKRRLTCLNTFLTAALTLLFIVVIAGFFHFGIPMLTSFACDDLRDEPKRPASSCSVIIPAADKKDCWPEAVGATEEKCQARGCCWGSSGSSMYGLGNVPYCYFPQDYEGYVVDKTTSTPHGLSVSLSRATASGWPDEISHLQMDVMFESRERLHFKIYDPSNKRYEVPIKLNPVSTVSADYDYDVSVPESGPFSIKVTRKSTGQNLFNSTGGAPLIFADQFIQFGTSLSTNFLYGLGEHRSRFMVTTNWTKLGMWSRDQAPARWTNLYGVHPFYLHVEPDKKAHGVFLLNSNAMEVETQLAPALTYRTTGGILDFYLFTGPTPNNVVQQYTALIGRPFMPPYWALGFHLCRYNYGSAEKMKVVIDRMRAAQMPYDTQWNDIDYMREYLDWTYDTDAYNDLPQIVDDLHKHGQHYIMIVDPGISNIQKKGTYKPFDDGLQQNVFIQKPDGSGPIIGKVWPGTTAFPDFFHPNTTQYWTNQIKDFHQQIPFDGLWIDMNEPSNFVQGSVDGCPNNTLENPQFHPGGVADSKLSSKTLCLSAKQYMSTHYNLHSLYGHSEAVATMAGLKKVLPRKRSIVISRSSYPGTGVHSGHWTGDNHADWDDMYYSIPAIMNFNMFGISLVGADICGFSGDTNPELCARWMQLGAFYPFMRNHNDKVAKDQDPAVFDSKTQDIMRFALRLRYSLLPNLYTLFYRNHVDGTPIIQPLFFQFPNDQYIYDVDGQFMWGSTLLITPVTSQHTTVGLGYLPSGRWYDFYNHSSSDSPGHLINFDLPADKINVQVRAGSIIPMQAPNITTTLSRKNNFTLYAALTVTGTAKGELYWDDGEEENAIENGHYNLIQFNVAASTLSSTIVKSGFKEEKMTLGIAVILGVDIAPTSVSVNGKQAHYTYKTKTVTVTGFSADLLQPLNISWYI